MTFLFAFALNYAIITGPYEIVFMQTVFYITITYLYMFFLTFKQYHYLKIKFTCYCTHSTQICKGSTNQISSCKLDGLVMTGM